MRVALVLLALLATTALAAPASQAVPTTLYAHVLAPGQDFALNTQEPDASWTVDDGMGLATSTLSCLPNPPGGSQPFGDWHTLYGFVSPNTVEYQVEEDSRPHIHPERGVQADIALDEATPMVLHWYLSSPDPTDPSTQAMAAPTPNVVVRATMRAGDAISVDDEAYNGGPVIAQGTSVPATLAGQFSQGIEHDAADGRTVYHFVVPMTLESPGSPAILRSTGFNLRVDTFVQNDLCAEGQLMPNSVLVHTSPGHRPRLELGVMEPLRLQYAQPQVVEDVEDAEDQFLVHTSILDVWGTYDLASLNVSVERPGLAAVDLEALPPPIRVHEHGHYGDNFERAWLWNSTEPAPTGRYIVHVSATTLQGYTQSWDIPVEEASAQATPGPAPLMVVLALAGLAAVLRRRS